MDKDMSMTGQDDDLLIGFEKELLERIQVLEDALQEILDIANVSEGRSAAFYGMLAQKALERGKIEGEF
tara:strand:+ start:1337 stop:1543 length:207 start_codon:yes stop_codon:yes gene_type:complete